MLQEAQKRKVLHLRMQQKMAVLGAQHPDVFRSMNEVALSWYYQKHYVAAERLESQRLDLSIELYGPESEVTWRCLRALRASRVKLGRLEEAEQV